MAQSEESKKRWAEMQVDFDKADAIFRKKLALHESGELPPEERSYEEIAAEREKSNQELKVLLIKMREMFTTLANKAENDESI